MNYMQKAVVELAANHPDIIILDDATLEWIGGQDGFQDLSAIVASGSLDKDDPRLKWGTNPQSGKEELYGVDITDSAFVAALPVNKAEDENMIIGVLGGTKSRTRLFLLLSILPEDQLHSKQTQDIIIF